jgi:hypothetical protein
MQVISFHYSPSLELTNSEPVYLVVKAVEMDGVINCEFKKSLIQLTMLNHDTWKQLNDDIEDYAKGLIKITT